MRSKALTLICAALLTGATGATAFADDGEKVLKRMTGGSIDNQLTVLPEDVGLHVSEAEHAFTDMMKFYVPTQQASGLVLTDGVEYLNADGELVETLTVAKPLVNVFIYGPAAGVPDTPFAHSFMDTFAAVSLDDGLTWKTINLSESADQSSFVLGQATSGGGGSDDDGDHHRPLPTLELESAVWTEQNKNKGKLAVEGMAESLDKVEIVNYTTGEFLFKTQAKIDGEFEDEKNLPIEDAPCMVQAVVDGDAYSTPVSVEYPEGTTVDCSGVDLAEYPGGVYNVFHATAGNKVLVAWPSRFCKQGQPAYSFAWDGDDADKDPALIDKRDAVADLFNEDEAFDVATDLYLTDLFGVAGSQRSINFAEEGYPQAGEVPFGCVWTARGVLVPGDDPRTTEEEASHMVWTKAERLTSGRRDPNRIEVKGVKGAGFVITWQEDPDGLRPGQGLGPGEGWSGAVAHSKTDVWYSFIPWEYFDLVENPDAVTGDPVSIYEHDLLLTGRPQVYVPMAVPMRLTNNDKCVPGVTTERFSYCNGDVASAYGLPNFCAAVTQIPQGPTGAPGDICVADTDYDGVADLPNVANTAATRPRTSLQGYDSDGDGETDSAWVIVATEESKGLGRFFFEPDQNGDGIAEPCEEEDPAKEYPCTAEIGKNQWYFSFDMGDPATSATAAEPNGLVQNLVSQGNMINQPEVHWETGEFYGEMLTADMWDFGEEYNFSIYNTEIARRSSLLVQSIAKARESDYGLLAMHSFKQGQMRQGGPADTMFRRIVATDFDEGIANNPYAFANMACEEWAVFTDADGNAVTNPYYPGGVCLEPATNLSAVVPDTCLDDADGSIVDCPTVDFTESTYGIGDTNPILQGVVQGEGNTTRVLTWHQCPSDGAPIASSLDGSVVLCGDVRTDEFANLKDQSWYNPLDVSKGHRGFIDGDFVMFLYAWSPNWRLNAKGSDRYDLYVRRSFDGGDTWQTTPTSFAAADGVDYSLGDGTVTCESYRSAETGTGGGELEPQVCYEYGPGTNEQARNVTQHSRMRITTLDPRYAPTPGSITLECLNGLLVDPVTGEVIEEHLWTCDDTSEMDSDLRNPSRYFMVYETGDNSTVQAGEAEPLDLYYSRAVNFGDDYVVWAEETDLSVCYPSDPHGDDVSEVVAASGFCNEFDRMNAGGDTHSSEANLEANPDGSKLYSVWAQWVYDYTGEEVAESEAMARRIWWIEDYIPSDAWEALIGQGQQ